MQAVSQPKLRILLVESDERFRYQRAKRLLSLGYRVSAVAEEEAPIRFAPRLYDAVIIDARHSATVSFDFCDHWYKAGQQPLVVVLAGAGFELRAPSLPAVVLAEASEAATDEKLLAVLRSLAMARSRPARG